MEGMWFASSETILDMNQSVFDNASKPQTKTNEDQLMKEPVQGPGATYSKCKLVTGTMAKQSIRAV